MFAWSIFQLKLNTTWICSGWSSLLLITALHCSNLIWTWPRFLVRITFVFITCLLSIWDTLVLNKALHFHFVFRCFGMWLNLIFKSSYAANLSTDRTIICTWFRHLLNKTLLHFLVKLSPSGSFKIQCPTNYSHPATFRFFITNRSKPVWTGPIVLAKIPPIF